MKFRARAPLRIDFGGGWTDVPFYALTEGGAVVNAAITPYVQGHISRPPAGGPFSLLNRSRTALSYSLDVPAGAGLGASAAQTVLWVTLVKSTIANVVDRREIAEIACGVGAALGIVGGKQDEYASALGGIAYYTFGTTVQVHPLDLAPTLVDELRSRLVLVYSGTSRLSGSVHQHVWERYEKRHSETVNALHSLKRLASEMRDALVAGNFDTLASLLDHNWTFQKALHPSVTTPRLDEIFHFAHQNGALGGKACGAGGGGCLLFMTRAGGAPQLREALRHHGLPLIDFDFDTYGVQLTKG